MISVKHISLSTSGAEMHSERVVGEGEISEGDGIFGEGDEVFGNGEDGGVTSYL